MLLSSSTRSVTLLTTIATAAKLLESTCPAVVSQGVRALHINSRPRTGIPFHSSPSLFSIRQPSLASETKLKSPVSAIVRTMASAQPTDQAINDILDYWFSFDAKGWFMNSSENDRIITERFGPLVEKARLTDELDSWKETPAGSLALIILLDQFTRNIFRPGNHPEPGLSWSGDAKALSIAAETIAKGFDRKIAEEHASAPMMGFTHRFFVYMPYMHAEDIHAQIASCALFENLGHEFELLCLKKGRAGEELSENEKALKGMIDAGTGMAVKHRDCIVQVGRFPKRNEPLGRETSQAEKQFLEKHPQGF